MRTFKGDVVARSASSELSSILPDEVNTIATSENETLAVGGEKLAEGFKEHGIVMVNLKVGWEATVNLGGREVPTLVGEHNAGAAPYTNIGLYGFESFKESTDEICANSTTGFSIVSFNENSSSSSCRLFGLSSDYLSETWFTERYARVLQSRNPDLGEYTPDDYLLFQYAAATEDSTRQKGFSGDSRKGDTFKLTAIVPRQMLLDAFGSLEDASSWDPKLVESFITNLIPETTNQDLGPFLEEPDSLVAFGLNGVTHSKPLE